MRITLRILLATALASSLHLAVSVLTRSEAPLARQRSLVRLTSQPLEVMPGEWFTVRGRASTHVVRPVLVERYRAGAWSPVARARTTRTGYFRVPRVSLRREAPLRVRLPAYTREGTRFLAARQGLGPVSVVRQSAGPLTLLPAIAAPGPEPADVGTALMPGHARFLPARPGRPVVVQRRVPGGTWRTVARTTEDSRGRVALRVPAAVSGQAEHRAVAVAYRGASAMPTEVLPGGRWSLSFDEQFSDGWDHTRWVSRGTTHSPAATRTCARADDSMVQVVDGVARLSVAPDPTLAGTTCTWTNDVGQSGQSPYFLNAHIGTQTSYTFRYGLAAARVRFQRPRGMHGAFWMQDASEPYGTNRAEIDTVEFFGDGYPGGGLASFVHPASGEKIGAVLPGAAAALRTPEETWWNSYHVFSVEWTPRQYVFRVDGHVTLRTDRGVADRKVFLVLSLLTSDWELADLPADGQGSAEVDWVRVWQDARLAGSNL